MPVMLRRSEPAIASNVSVTTADKNQYILVNVTSAVQAWLSGSETNNGVALVANSPFNATFDSKGKHDDEPSGGVGYCVCGREWARSRE